jgi:1,2-diacylglycerol 3-beta-glucosyltransferase
MKTFTILIDIMLLLPSLLFASYLALLTVLAIFRKSKIDFNSAKKIRRFAILVPAHEEEEVIEQTLQSMKGIDYPRESFDVVVIADNCTDKTAELSRSTGATVLERHDPVNRSKGYALRWCLDRLTKGESAYEAFVVIDADSVVSPNFLAVMNRYLDDGARCIQSSDLAKPQPGKWSPEMTRIAFILHNYVRPLGKMAAGLSANLNGNGMCFSRELITQIPWSSYSRVEDLEYTLKLILNGVKITFAPEAVVHATMPTDSKIAETQRRRWEVARFPVVKEYAGKLFSTAIRKKSLVTLDMLLELITPAFVNLFLFTSALLVLQVAAFVLGATWLGEITLLFAIAVLLDVFHVLGGLKAAHANRSDYLVLANIPKYILWKIGLYFRTWLRGDDKSWVRTQRRDRLAG